MASKHPNPSSNEKRFKHYLFDFFMLFLAVTLGFFVENMREHLVEQNRERDYVLSVAEDLKQDIYQMDSIINKRVIKNQMMDSILFLLNSPQLNERGNDIYYYARWLPRTYRFYPNDRTFQQLNSGNWRLIRNNKVSNVLLAYNSTVRSIISYIEQREEALIILMYPSLSKLFDNQVFESMVNGLTFKHPTGNPHLLSTDKAALNEFCNQIHFAKNSNYYFITTSKSLRSNALNTLEILKREYHLQIQ